MGLGVHHKCVTKAQTHRQTTAILLPLALPEVRGGDHRQVQSLSAHLQIGHVYPVNVGPLLPVQLDIDKRIVHDLRDRLVFERLVCEHMAPGVRVC
jgi:hypothetical protein